MTKEELLIKTNHSLTMKQLREFVEKNKDIPDSAPCIVERVTDLHFESRELQDGTTIKGWDILKVEGYHYHSSLEWNKKIQKEIDRRAKGEDPEYDRLDNPEDTIYGEKDLEETKEQFYQPHCITTDKEIVYIYSHY